MPRIAGAGQIQASEMKGAARWRWAAISSCIIILPIFVVFLNAPFRIGGDIAYVAKAAEQHVVRGVPFNELRLVDPCDLSRDIDTWIFWWPPGIGALLSVLLSLGISTAIAAKTIMVTAAVVGAIGWARVSAGLFAGRLALTLSAIPTLMYILNNEMFTKFDAGDPLVFAITPWLFALSFRVLQDPHNGHVEHQIGTLAFLCGLLYWVKYSAMFPAAAIMLSVVVVAIQAECSLRRLASIVVAATLFILPVALLWYLNRTKGGDFIESSIGGGTSYPDLLGATLRAVSMTVLPIDVGIQRWLPSGPLSLAVRFVSGALVILVVCGAWRVRGWGIGVFSALLALVPLVTLGFLTWKSGYGFLLDADRHAGAYWIFFQLILIGLLVGDTKVVSLSTGHRAVLAGIVVVLLAFAWYGSYAATRSSVDDLQADADPERLLAYPTLSKFRSGELAQAIRSRLAPNDVVVLASYWLGMDSWLAFDQRLLPLTNFYQPLAVTHGRDGARYDASSPLTSSQTVRLILVLTDPYSEPNVGAWNERIKKRFAQVGSWEQVNADTDGRVTILLGKIELPSKDATEETKCPPRA